MAELAHGGADGAETEEERGINQLLLETSSSWLYNGLLIAG
jgi:hypothetical protein